MNRSGNSRGLREWPEMACGGGSDSFRVRQEAEPVPGLEKWYISLLELW